MESDFIYWRHPTIPGIKVEEISGGERYEGKIWLETARQVYCENGKETYREIGHFQNGAPFLYGETARISITHCKGLLAIATLPSTPEVELSAFTRRAALGVDAERADREQVLNLRERFLSDEELALVPAEDLTANILAWTAKEALYKAALTPGLDFRDEIKLLRLPKLSPSTPVFDPKEFGLPAGCQTLPADFYGQARVRIETHSGDEGQPASDSWQDFTLYSYMSDDCVVTLAYSPQSAKFGKA